MKGVPRLSVVNAWAVGLLAAACAGCMPHIMHGPRVEEDGVSGSLSLSVGRNYDAAGSELRIVPSLYGGVRRSWLPADGDGIAGSIGIQVPLLLAPLLADGESGRFSILTSTSYVDTYIQPRRRSEAGIETGVGMLVSTALVGPYLQAGVMREGGSGWYTTQAVAFTIGDEFGQGTFYLPAIAWRHRDPDLSTAANFSAGMGVRLGADGESDTLFVLGVTLELGLDRN
ncbi:MAG: hypothetical protein KFH98_03840 [Gemmatimonadetes bacterium]|nr:hypothetical protein [Gemmatimonadota bacterium]